MAARIPWNVDSLSGHGIKLGKMSLRVGHRDKGIVKEIREKLVTLFLLLTFPYCQPSDMKRDMTSFARTSVKIKHIFFASWCAKLPQFVVHLVKHSLKVWMLFSLAEIFFAISMLWARSLASILVEHVSVLSFNTWVLTVLSVDNIIKVLW